MAGRLVEEAIRKITAHTKELMKNLADADEETQKMLNDMCMQKLTEAEEKFREQVRTEEVERKEHNEKTLKKMEVIYRSRNAKLLQESPDLAEHTLDQLVIQALKRREMMQDQSSRSMRELTEHYAQDSMQRWHRSVSMYMHRRQIEDAGHRLKIEQRLEYNNATFRLTLESKIRWVEDQDGLFAVELEELVENHNAQQSALMAAFSASNYEVNEGEIARIEELSFTDFVGDELLFG